MCQLILFSCFRSSAQLGRMMEQLSSLEVVTSRSKCGLCCQVVSLRRLRCMMRLSRRSHGFLRWIFLSLEAGIRLWGVHAVCCSKSSPFSLGSWIHIVNWCSLMLLPMAAYYYSMFFKRISMLPTFVNVFLTVENQHSLYQIVQKIYVFHPFYLSILVFMPSAKLMVSYHHDHFLWSYHMLC